MLNNFIYAKQKSLFISELEKGNILDEAIVFIEDTKEIWNHGTYFDCSSVDLSNYNTKEEIASELAKYATTSDLSNAMSGVTGQINNLNNNINNGLSTANQNAESARNLAQSVQDSLSSYATQTYVNTQISNLVDSAPETLNTLNELATAITEHKEVTDLLDSAISNKADKTELPTKVSQLENDVPYALKSDVEVEIEVPNGVYAVTADGKLIDYTTADATATGVALVAGEYKFMIAKSDATNDGSNYYLHWGNNTSDLSLTNYSNADGINPNGYLPYLDGNFAGSTHLSDDYTTWTNGALSDFNGKANTEVISGASSDALDMCTVLNTFNASDSFKDWYVPALGQLALMYLNVTEINEALDKIGGTALDEEYYWSSSEYSSTNAWYVSFINGGVDSFEKGIDSQVRFIRDISVSKPLKERVSELEENIPTKLSQLESSISNVYSIGEIDSMLSISKYEFVDLGLPSGLKWATTNIGAENPEDRGLYFSWGETKGYEGLDEFKEFSWGDYKWGNSTSSISKYNTSDKLTVLESVDDAAYQSDNTSKMPTPADLQELIANTTSTWETLNGVNGRRFTSKTNGNSIFIPASGCYNEGEEFNYNNLSLIWTSAVNKNSPVYGYKLNSSSVSTTIDISDRYSGIPIRPVQDPSIDSKLKPFEVYSRLDNLEKENIPTKTSELINNSNFISDDIGIDYSKYADGVYAVSANGELVDYNTADTSCLGVALIAGEHRFMIANYLLYSEKSMYSNSLHYLYSCEDCGLTKYDKVDNTNREGYFPMSDGSYAGEPQLSTDYTTWTSGALSDFDGKNNTTAIALKSNNEIDMCKILMEFNNSSRNQNYTDWYVPALGQVALMYMSMEEINTAIHNVCGGNNYNSFNRYSSLWSSTEYDDERAWFLDFYEGWVQTNGKDGLVHIRPVRNLSSSVINSRVTTLESQLQSLVDSPAARITEGDVMLWNNKVEQTEVVEIVENMVSGKLDKDLAASTYLPVSVAASTYLSKTGKAASASVADSATKDGAGYVISATYATKTENNTKVTGDGVMTIKKVTALPSSPDPNTLYVITKTS